ncbi:MAG: CPBP family intramembrane metalloprotease [Candidatus Aminicenantes bacterium]|nr:CPBP family intramembrane metalloprotease [Candidatus Aminicenantes bacterium]
MSNKIKPMPLGLSFVYFGIPAVYFWLLTKYFTPYLNDTVGMHPAMSWFITGFLVFIPLFSVAVVFAKKEGHSGSLKALAERLRLKKFTKKDWTWALGGLVAIFLFTGMIMGISDILSKNFGIPELKTTPGFMEFEAFKAGERWMLLVWLSMFFFNITGEEMFWRGYILPRQELANPKFAWFINSVLWGVFHVSFGFDLLIILIPILIILPLAVYKTKNTGVGIFIHTLLNGPMFVLVSLGIFK